MTRSSVSVRELATAINATSKLAALIVADFHKAGVLEPAAGGRWALTDYGREVAHAASGALVRLGRDSEPVTYREKKGLIDDVDSGRVRKVRGKAAAA